MQKRSLVPAQQVVMLVPVCVDGARNEWSIVELQGGLVADDGAALAGGVDIGTLRFVDGVPTIRIGNHILAGKVAKLPKPFAILQKEEDVVVSDPSAQTQEQPLSDDAMSDSSADNNTGGAHFLTEQSICSIASCLQAHS